MTLEETKRQFLAALASSLVDTPAGPCFLVSARNTELLVESAWSSGLREGMERSSAGLDRALYPTGKWPYEPANTEGA